MSAQTTLKSGIKKLSEDMLAFDGSEGKTKTDADEFYSEQLASLIDTHAKALVAKIGIAEIALLVLTSPSGPVVATAPNDVPLTIDDSLPV